MGKQMAVSYTALYLVSKLSIANPQHIRITRITYTVYLVLYHAVLMWMRVTIHNNADTTEVVVPPNPQLAKMLSSAVGGGKTSAHGTEAGAGGTSMEDMLSKFTVRKTTVKSYDIAAVDSLRSALVRESIILSLLHLKLGMIKPVILGVAMNVWRFLEHPLFKIYVLGMQPQGKLARPFKKDDSLSDWMKQQAETAKAGCPVSKALAGTEIHLKATLL